LQTIFQPLTNIVQNDTNVSVLMSNELFGHAFGLLFNNQYIDLPGERRSDQVVTQLESITTVLDAPSILPSFLTTCVIL